MVKVKKTGFLLPDLTVEEVSADLRRWFDSIREYLASPEATTATVRGRGRGATRERDAKVTALRQLLDAEEAVLTGTSGRSLIDWALMWQKHKRFGDGAAGRLLAWQLLGRWWIIWHEDFVWPNPTTINEAVAIANAVLHSGDLEPVQRLGGWHWRREHLPVVAPFEEVAAARIALATAPQTVASLGNGDHSSPTTGESFCFGGKEYFRRPSNIWYYKGAMYETKGPHTAEEFRLLVKEEFDRERRLFERLRHRHEGVGAEEGYPRQPIPESVRIEVWRRDGGKCAKCGSRENLEYDHIVPVSKGGSNTARNIELLCETCNRSKGANIG